MPCPANSRKQAANQAADRAPGPGGQNLDRLRQASEEKVARAPCQKLGAWK